MPANAVNVARPGKWGNPFVVGRDGTRAQCVAMFVSLYRGFIAFSANIGVDEQLALYSRLRRSVPLLKGRDLACWCPLDGAPCHADVLLHLANDTPLPAWAGTPIELPRVRLGMDARQLLKLRRSAAADTDSTDTPGGSGTAREAPGAASSGAAERTSGRPPLSTERSRPA
jgi:hypothetical protein